jgi:O-antigen/teichoic acid export membrane protein
MLENVYTGLKARYNGIISDPRSRILFKNTVFSLFSKGITMITGFLLIPLSLKLVNKSEFGLWLTISSFLGWLSLLDLGVGNGLRNKLTEALAKGDKQESKSLVSTAYFITAFVFTTAILVFFMLANFIDWSTFLNASFIDETRLKNIVVVTFSCFALQMILRLIFTIYMSTHKVGKVDLLNSIGQVCIVGVIYLMTRFNSKTDQIVELVLINNLVPLAFLIVASIYTFAIESPDLTPSIKKVEISKGKSIFGLGISFLFIQLASYLIIGSQQFIIGKIFSQESVVNFSIPHKYYSVLLVGWTIVIAPFWSLLTEAHEKGDITWIKQQKKRMFRLYILIPIAGFFLYFIAPLVYRIWVGDNYFQSTKLDLSLIFFYCVLCFNSTVVVFLNAFSRTKVQLIISTIVAFLAIGSCFLVNGLAKSDVYSIPLICTIYLLIAGIIVYFELNKYITEQSKLLSSQSS